MARERTALGSCIYRLLARRETFIGLCCLGIKSNRSWSRNVVLSDFMTQAGSQWSCKAWQKTMGAEDSCSNEHVLGQDLYSEDALDTSGRRTHD